MYASLKSWVNVPYQFKPFLKRDGAGTKMYGETVDSLCYPVGDAKIVTNADGAEVISTTQLYVHGTDAIKVTDEVTFNGATYPVQRIADFYRNGVVDVRVVYL